MKYWVAILSAVILLSGCASVPPAETTASTTEYIAPSTTASTEPEQTTSSNVPDTDASNASSSDLKNAKIHIADANWDLESYQDAGVLAVYLHLLSDTAIQKKDINIELPVEIPYSFELHKADLGDAPKFLESNPGANILFTYDIYLNYCDFDWSALQEKYQTAQELGQKPPADRTAEDRKQYTEALKEYDALYNSLREEYQQLGRSMLPQFECYQISLYLETAALENDVAFNTITVTIAGESKALDIGQVQLFAESYFDVPEEPWGISKYPLGTNTPIPDLSGNLTRFGGCFTADEDVLLTGYELLVKDMEIAELQVRIGSDSGKSSDFVWDGKMPVSVDKGCNVEINLNITDPRLAKSGCDFKGFIWMEYEVDGVVYEHCFPDRMRHEPNPYEEYAKHFDGIDFTEYYEEYYYPIVLGIES